jgi:hypothetical protein
MVGSACVSGVRTHAEDREATIQAAIAELAGALDAAAVGEAIGRHAARTVFEHFERRDDDLEHETMVAAASNVSAVLNGLVSGLPVGDATVPPETLQWASTLAHRGVSRAAIPRCYVVGQAMLDESLRGGLADIDLPFELKWELAGTLSRYVFGYVEKVCGEAVEQFQLERERWLRGADALRTELVLSMVEGKHHDATPASASLGYELDRPHIALLVWADPRRDEPPQPASLRAAASRLAADIGGQGLLVIEAGQSVVWAWTTGDQLGDGLGTTLKVDRELLAATGGVAYGVEGFVRSHREAREARRMAGLFASASGSVVRYRSVALSSLLSSDPGSAAHFITTELGPLCADNDANRRMRATLGVFFEEGMSWQRTARRLGVHQNTVMYRVRRAEEILGRPLAERRLELESALRLADAREALRAAGSASGAG